MDAMDLGSLNWWAINAGYPLISYCVIGVLLALWR